MPTATLEAPSSAASAPSPSAGPPDPGGFLSASRLSSPNQPARRDHAAGHLRTGQSASAGRVTCSGQLSTNCFSDPGRFFGRRVALPVRPRRTARVMGDCLMIAGDPRGGLQGLGRAMGHLVPWALGAQLG